jgi:glycine/sarcosine N-methyltransferase
MALDQWSRVDYRRSIAWPDRIEREWPFLERILRSAPPGAVVDLGSGTGEHSRHLAANGFDVIGIEASMSMIDAACSEALPPNLRFVNADIADLGAIDVGQAGAAICLGNTLPYLDHDDLRRLAQGLSGVLESGSPFVVQVLNYERIRAKKIRSLPLNFRPDEEGGEIVYLRLLDPKSDGTVIFTPATLRYKPGADPPVEIVHARSITLHGWTWVELWDIFGAAGFQRFDLFGGFDGSLYKPAESSDVIAVLRR